MNFGEHIRRLRQRHYRVNRRYSLVKIAGRIGLDPIDLEQIERGEAPPPEQEIIRRLAAELGEDADVLLALAGEVASDIYEAITRRPVLFAELIRGLGDMPEKNLAMLVCKIRNNQW